MNEENNKENKVDFYELNNLNLKPCLFIYFCGF